MSKLDQPLKLKHGLAAAVAIMAVSITGTAIAGGGGGGGGGGGTLHYVDRTIGVNANSQRNVKVDCPRGTHVTGGGVEGSAPFRGGGGQMINTSAPDDDNDGNNKPDDGWLGTMDNFANTDFDDVTVWAICKG